MSHLWNKLASILYSKIFVGSSCLTDHTCGFQRRDTKMDRSSQSATPPSYKTGHNAWLPILYVCTSVVFQSISDISPDIIYTQILSIHPSLTINIQKLKKRNHSYFFCFLLFFTPTFKVRTRKEKWDKSMIIFLESLFCTFYIHFDDHLWCFASWWEFSLFFSNGSE